MGQHSVERPGHVREIERFDEQARVADLAAATAAHEAPKLLVGAPSLPGRLHLQGAERPDLSLSIDDLLDGIGAECADQLLLQIDHAHVEAQPFHLDSSEVGAGPVHARGSHGRDTR